MNDILDVFTSWEPLMKARRAAGLNMWDRFKDVAHRLEGKGKSDISFTCGHPSCSGDKHVLGSTMGSLHFLLGYANPGFCVAPYHWQIMDPSLDDEEADVLYEVKGHPSRPELWEASGLTVEDEGDMEDGSPHPTVASAKGFEFRRKEREEGSQTVTLGIGKYTAVPSEGLLYGQHNQHVYPWELVKESFFSAVHPEVALAMDLFEAEQNLPPYPQEDNGPEVPEMVKHLCTPDSFSSSVYPLVQSHFPQPGSVVPLIDASSDKGCFGVVTKSTVDFYTHDGARTDVLIYGRLCDSLDLEKGGNTHPSVLHSFAISHLGMDAAQLEDYASHQRENHTKVHQDAEGAATRGFDEYSASSNRRAVEVHGNTFRLIVSEE